MTQMFEKYFEISKTKVVTYAINTQKVGLYVKCPQVQKTFL